MGILISMSDRFPALGLGCGCERQLKLLGAEPGRYMGMAIVLSAAAGALALFLFPGFAVPAALLASAFSLAFLLVMPAVEIRKKALEIEAHMPFFLRGLGMLLQMGIPWRRAMEIASEGSGALEGEMALVLRAMDEGSGFHRALAHLAAFDSMAIKRAASQMASAYDTGASGAEMERIGDEMLALGMHRMREHGSRSAMFGLLFVLFSAIAPTFFLIYSVAGPLAFSGNSADAGQMTLALLVIFPSISALVLLVGKSMMPKSPFAKEGGISPLMLAPAAIMLAGFLLLPDFPLPVVGAGIAAGIFIAYGSFMRERRLEEIDAALPDALFSVSGMPGSSSARRVFALVEEGGFGALSIEAGKSRRQLDSNISVGAVLDDFSMRNRSGMVRRASVMMRHMIETSSLGKLGILAEDMIRSAQAVRERGQQFATQKYTLIFGAVLMPVVFRMAIGLSETIASISGAGIAADFPAIVPPYIVIYASLASFAISDAEGKKSALAAYSLAMAVAALAAFHFLSF
ncbi:type II secretion system F family protein [Candidatus Micrarchaeota archaeon]|nr:type II secretion system F family protein [Candidatus Micrarchaeota archaeon]